MYKFQLNDTRLATSNRSIKYKLKTDTPKSWDKINLDVKVSMQIE